MSPTRTTWAVVRYAVLTAIPFLYGVTDSHALPQEPVEAPEVNTQVDSLFNKWIDSKLRQDSVPDEGTITGPKIPPQSTLEILAQIDSTTAGAYLEALREQYEYKVIGFNHRKRVFAWQFYSSILIFILVNILVLVGVYFSWAQFKRDLEVPPNEVARTELAVSPQGITVQSSILGVIILVLSFLFFYLYLVHVYPINEIL